MLEFFWQKLKCAWAKPQQSTPLENRMDKLLEKLADLEKKQEDLFRLLSQKSWTIEKVVIEKMHNDKLEFKLDSIDIKELSGMLNLGMTYGGNLYKTEPAENKPGNEITPIQVKFERQAPQGLKSHKKKRP